MFTTSAGAAGPAWASPSPGPSSRPTASASWRDAPGGGAPSPSPCRSISAARPPARAWTPRRGRPDGPDPSDRRRPLAAAGPADRPRGPRLRGRLARTGEEGIVQASLTAPDVVVLDLGLPDLDGIEVCRRLRSWSQVPIIVLSAAGSEERKVAALDDGADDYVTKPFGMAELEARMRVALRRAAAAADPAEPPRSPSGGSTSTSSTTWPAGRGAPRSDRPGVRPPRLSGPPRRQGLHPPDDPAGRLGLRLRHRVALPPGLRPPAAPQARRGRPPAADPTGHRLPATDGRPKPAPGPRPGRTRPTDHSPGEPVDGIEDHLLAASTQHRPLDA